MNFQLLLLFFSYRLFKSPICLSAFVILLTACGSASEGESDPIDVDVAVAYVDRSLYTDSDNDGEADDPVYDDIHNPRLFNGGARLMLRDRTNKQAEVKDITSAQFPNELYDVKDLSPSADGTKLLFAMRAPQLANVDEDDQPTWNIWEYNLTTSNLRRVIKKNSTASLGHDIDPSYLPDGRIVFASTRQKGGLKVLSDEAAFHNKTAFAALTDSRGEINNDGDGIGEAFNLHVVEAEEDESGDQTITQISYNQSHDLQPTILNNGRVAFLRWDGAEGNDQLSIYSVNPDGSKLELLYGYHSQINVTMSNGSDESATFFDLTPFGEGKLLALLKLRNNTSIPDPDNIIDDKTNSFLGGYPIIIDYGNFTESNQRVNGSSAGSAGLSNLSTSTIDISNNISANGYFNSAAPLNDGSNRLYVTRTICGVQLEENGRPTTCVGNLNNPAATEADPFYGLWIFDLSDDTYTSISNPEIGRMFTDVAVLNATTLPTVILPNNSNEATGTLNIKSIYDFDGTIAQTPNDVSLADLSNPANAAFASREARFLRVVKAVSMPDDEVYDFDNSAFGVSNQRNMREILGYAPIEPDGSITVKIPANVAFQIDIVDRNGRRLNNFDIHSNWLTLAAGETLQCKGCHTATSQAPHGRFDAQAASANPGAPTAGAPFPNTTPTYVAGGVGWTMAETYTVAEEARALSPNIVYTDEWSDDTVVGVTKETDYELRYAASGAAQVTDIVPNVPIIPSNLSCIIEWNASCRIIINYETHIQPMWTTTRTGEQDYQCVSCHSTNGNTQQAAGQLELNDTKIGDFNTSYTELLQNDTVVVVNPLIFRVDGDNNQLFLTRTVTDDNGTPADPSDDTTSEVDVLDKDGNRIPLIDRAPGNQTTGIRIQSRDENGNLLFVVLDDMGTADPADDVYALDGTNQIPVTEAFPLTVGDNINRRMVASSAANSRFFDVLTNPANAANSSFNHTRLNQMDDTNITTDDGPLMNPHELRLLSEWLDIGAQYYNNPFDAPEN